MSLVLNPHEARWLPFACLSALLCCSCTSVKDSAELSDQRLRNSLRLHAQLLCSGVFVSGRSPESVIERDLQWAQYTFHDWNTTHWQVDSQNQLVTLSQGETSELFSATSRHTPGLGCTLLPDGLDRASFEYVGTPPQTDTTDDWKPADGSKSDDSSRSGRGKAHRSPPLTVRELTNQVAVERWLDRAFNDHTRPAQPQKTRAMLVLYQGDVIAERYAPGFTADMPMLGWSMGKSVAAALLGVYAKETPSFNVDAPTGIAAWSNSSDKRRAITPRHLLNMAGGLAFTNPSFGDPYYYTDSHQHESVYFKPQDTRELVLNAPLAYSPGTQFEYRNTNTLSLMALVRQNNESRGESPLSWPREALFEPLGATSFVLEPDYSGNFVITGFVYATARDWGRMGQLFLNDGLVGEQRLWPEGWARTLREPSPSASFYGGQIWLNELGGFPNIPRDAYYFLGWLDQVVMVIPSHDLVVVRLGFSADGGFRDYFDGLVRELIELLDDVS